MRVLLLLPLLLLGACGDPVENHIAALLAGGEEAEVARLELNLAKKDAIEPLIRALENRAHPSRARVAFAEVLYGLYLREDNKKVLQVLIAALEDDDPELRRGVARSLGDLKRREAALPLLARLEVEREERIQTEILTALEAIVQKLDVFLDAGAGWGQGETQYLEAEDKKRFGLALQAIIAQTQSDTLRGAALEWLEVLAEEKTVAAYKLALKADLQNAENLLQEARDLVPDSKNVNQKRARFYYENEQREKGLEILDSIGLIAHAPRFTDSPTIDGALDEPVWQQASILDDFYASTYKYRVQKASGRSEAFIGYRDQTVYVGVKVYEPTTQGLAADARGHDDGNTWRDDCVELYFDSDHNLIPFVQIIINSVGAVEDRLNRGRDGGGTMDWNADGLLIATSVSETFWTVEAAVPAAGLDGGSIAPGAVWGFNICPVRVTNLSEFSQWAPTYGDSQRPDRIGYLVFGD